MNNMKKFVGNVNGKEFSNVEDFTKAVNDAIASGESPMMISSYYKECNCVDCEDSQKCVEDKKEEDENPKIEKSPLDFEKFLLNRESPKSGNTYKIPSNIKEMFDNASNIEEIKKEIDNKISANNNIIRNNNLQIGNLNKKIAEYNNKITNYNNDKDEANSQISYYNSLKDIINGKGCLENNNKKFIASDALKKNEKAMNIICDVINGFDKYLKDIGFWK